MTYFSRSCLAAAAFVACVPGAALAQATQLNPAAQRISDAAIRADQQAYEALQSRIKGLNDRGRPVRDYHLSKAQCWLDVSFHEYTRNDRGPFPQAALTESEKLVVAMEQGVTPLPTATPLVGEAVAIRPDLWAAAQALQGHAGWRCAQQKTACAEVELVHAGNEQAQAQWRHAKPYVQIAEDLLGEARALAEACLPPPAPPAPPPAPVPAPRELPPPVVVQQFELAAQVVFNFDKHTATDIRPWSTLQLEQLVAQVRERKLDVQAIRLVGHADRLNSTGQTDYNQQLSEKRVATVRDVLVKLGVEARLITTAARGDQQQVQGCEARFSKKADLEECLLPNRRVEVSISARQR
ncbi:OmpA family protein [Aquabacterium sp. OR-4]|uniref:OmpA family protein n=1 Tax=Aquabacterium sp. OR-4 TaxID=2978127 RepID=UPI0028C9DA20|nr:OmpA family protein [Aquabacterium sp. OR-4]MDT7837187.1 OmpA family protein [Aquabacterium sp. OR-4]